PDETMAINMNDKGVHLTNMTYNEAMIFLPQFDGLKYKVKEIYTYYKLNQPTKVSRFSIPPLIQHVAYEKRLKIVDTHEIDGDGVEIIKTLKLPVLLNAKLLSTLMIFDDIALRGILRGVPRNLGFAESYITENRVYPVFQLVLGLVAYPQVKKSNVPIPSVYYVAYSIGGVDEVVPTFHTPSLSQGSALQPVRTKLSQFALFFINLRSQLRMSSFGSIIIQPIA
ncbi:MAG: hypothetical protein EZS28_029343, partial [Streblomastix strix]